MVRRAAFLVSGLADKTKGGYVCENLAKSSSQDVASVASAYLRYKQRGLRRFVAGEFSFATSKERIVYEDVVSRGMEELGELLRSHGVI
jgi:hypothetical protein